MRSHDYEKLSLVDSIMKNEACSSGCGAFIESFANSPVEPTKGKQIFSNINGNACLIMIRSPEAPRGVIGIFRVPNMYEDYQF